MTYPEQTPQEPNALPGYFSPAEAPLPSGNLQPPATRAQSHQVPHYHVPQYQGRQMPAPVAPYAAPVLQLDAGDSISLPLYSASPVKAAGRFFRKYATFSGRASRSEFWWVPAMMAALFIAFAIIGGRAVDLLAWLYLVFLFACVIPFLALTVRRLHDANLNGGLAAMVLIPYVGFLVVAILAAMPSKPEGARYDRLPNGAGNTGLNRYQ